MTKSLFRTNEYRFLSKLQERMATLNTKKNNDVYLKYLSHCKELARTEYNNIGWREDLQAYAWDKSKEVAGYVIYNNLGDDVTGLSFYKGSTLFMCDQLKYWALKDANGQVTKYSPEETESIRFLTRSKLEKVHRTKVMFEGEIVIESKKESK